MAKSGRRWCQQPNKHFLEQAIALNVMGASKTFPIPIREGS